MKHGLTEPEAGNGGFRAVGARVGLFHVNSVCLAGLSSGKKRGEEPPIYDMPISLNGSRCVEAPDKTRQEKRMEH